MVGKERYKKSSHTMLLRYKPYGWYKFSHRYIKNVTLKYLSFLGIQLAFSMY